MPSFTSLAAALAFLASLAAAQDPNFDSINTPLKNAQVPAGQPFTITWSLLSATTPTGPATITLIGGDTTNNLHPIAAIGHVQNEDLKFMWNVDASLGAETVYGLNLTLDADTSHFQYSNPFTIVGGAASGSGSGSASGSASSTGTTSSTGASTSATGSASGTASTTVASGSATTSASSTTGSGGDATTSTTAPTTTAAAPTHASNSTGNSTSPSSTASKTTPATKPTTTSGATSLGLSAVGALAMALVASAALNWGL